MKLPDHFYSQGKASMETMTSKQKLTNKSQKVQESLFEMSLLSWHGQVRQKQIVMCFSVKSALGGQTCLGMGIFHLDI